jgi:hypothetical protein
MTSAGPIVLGASAMPNAIHTGAITTEATMVNSMCAADAAGCHDAQKDESRLHHEPVATVYAS